MQTFTRFHRNNQSDDDYLGELDVAATASRTDFATSDLNKGLALRFWEELGSGFEILFGTGKAGAVLVSVNWRWRSELQFLLEDSESQILFVTANSRRRSIHPRTASTALQMCHRLRVGRRRLRAVGGWPGHH